MSGAQRTFNARIAREFSSPWGGSTFNRLCDPSSTSVFRCEPIDPENELSEGEKRVCFTASQITRETLQALRSNITIVRTMRRYSRAAFLSFNPEDTLF
jgi:hypothetical protein